MRRILLLATLMITACCGAMAQGVTTSQLSGTIKDPSGGAIPGANIVATHTPSGTTYGTMSLADGKYKILNMRTGGPYSVKITFVGYGEQTFGEIQLRLGETYVLNASLAEAATELEEIVISGAEDKVMNSNRNGAVTNISTREILAMPSITRSINDMVRMTPQATSTSTGAIGGGNYRQNNITVDGSDFNNTFGIGGNLPANGSPISLDALEEISINVTPYDIRQSNFIGSSINAVTRSGGNDFSGSAYTFWRSENQQGDKVGANDPFIKQNLQDNTYGFRLGGPIIKNKLFFFVNAERGKRIAPGQQQVAATAAVPTGPNVSRPLDTQLDLISTFLKENYGYDTGPYQGYDFESDNTRFVARLDWNINSNHRFNIRYSSVESKAPSFMSSSQTGIGITYSPNRTSNSALWFSNSNYFQEANYYSLAAELNSVFAGKFANTLRATWTHQYDPRSTNGKLFPLVDIMEAGQIYTSFGYEPFSLGNLRDVTSYSVVDYVTWTMGKHTITGGFQIDLQSTKNGFQPLGAGYYRFNSWNDFATGAVPQDYALTYSLSPGYEQAFPRVKLAQYSVYGQDEFSVTDNLKVTVGLRVDLPTYPSVPEIQTHPLVAPLTFAGGRTIDTGVLPDAKLMFSPRVGFNWDVKGDRSMQLRGGTGIFLGRIPTVWIVAQSGNSGLLQISENYNGLAANAGHLFQVEPYRPATPPAAGTAISANLFAMDPDFKFPQTWKSSLAMDMKLPGGFIGSLELIYNKDLNIAIGQNYNLVDPQAMNINGNGTTDYSDNRPMYPVNSPDRYLNNLAAGLAVPTGTAGSAPWSPIVLGNAKNGWYGSVTARLDKQFSNGLSAFIAYTRTESKVLYDGIGDQPFNTWSLTPISGEANNPGMSYAGYTVPDRFIAGFTFRKEYLKRLATSISLFYEGSIAGRFSYTYNGDLNRDGQQNDLIYIPASPSDITFVTQTYGTVSYTAQQQSDMFFKYLEQDKYLSAHKGQYAERNGAKMPWRNQIDLRFAQDIFTNIGGKKNTLQFTLDIFNFGNLLHSNWGTFKTVNTPALLQLRNTNVAPGGAIIPTFSLANDRGAPVTSTFRDNNSITSTYYMQFGLRYTFN